MVGWCCCLLLLTLIAGASCLTWLPFVVGVFVLLRVGVVRCCCLVSCCCLVCVVYFLAVGGWLCVVCCLLNFVLSIGDYFSVCYALL